MIKFIIFLLSVFILANMLFAQNEIQLNSKTEFDQRDPQIEKLTDGSIIVVWDADNFIHSNSQSDIIIRKFNSDLTPISNEVAINDISLAEQEKPALDVSSSGNILVAYAANSMNYNKIYDIKAVLLDSELNVIKRIDVNTYTDYSQSNPDVVFLNDNSFFVVWDSWMQDGSDRGIIARHFNAVGEPISNEIQVNATTEFSQTRPNAIILENNGTDNLVLITWESWNQQNPEIESKYDIIGRVINFPNGLFSSETVLNNSYGNFDYQWFSDAVKTPTGFAAVWCSWEQDGYDGGIYANSFQLSNIAGEWEIIPLGTEIKLNETTAYYQWLPKIKSLNDKFAITWSSWLQDGSREGVYTRILNQELKPISFETQVNITSEGYQWEPEFIINDDNKLGIVYSSWLSDSNGYEIVYTESNPTVPQGRIKDNTYIHFSGRTTSRFRVHVIDSLLLTGSNYSITFNEISENNFNAKIENISSGITIIENFNLDRGENIFYLSDSFDGLAVEIEPEFDFELSPEQSWFVNNSGTDISFTISSATGTNNLAPIDIALIWGNTDTLANGNYANPLDTVYNSVGQLSMEVPFYAWNITDNYQIDMFIPETPSTNNNKWEPGEKIVFLTPSEYNPIFPTFHAELLNTNCTILPSIGDTNYILTTRPLTENDIFQFTANPDAINNLESGNVELLKFQLNQNYPNPFNPSTNISFSIPESGNVFVNIYDILGRNIETLINKPYNAGTYKLFFDGSNYASGIYIYSVRWKNNVLSKKMLLIK